MRVKSFITPLQRFLRLLTQGRPRTVGLMVFGLCCLIYMANGQAVTSNDNVPASILALNWLDNGVLHFDALRNGFFYENSTDIPYFFVEAPNGHLTSTYPIGTAIITFPLYLLMWIGLRSLELIQTLFTGTPVDLLDLTDEAARRTIYSWQKTAATVVASLSVVLFYLSLRLKFSSPVVLLVSTFIFAFCTTTWIISSQGLWQHGTGNLAVLAIIFSLLKANRASPSGRKRLLIAVGFFCGLLPGIRPTSVIYALAAIAYTLFTFRREALYLLLGLPSILLSACWNFYFFGFDPKYFLVGGYSRFASGSDSFTDQYYAFTWHQFKQGFFGSLISPSRGLLIFSPVTLLALPGFYQVIRQHKTKDEILLLVMTGAALVLFLQYSFFTVWTGGWTYGPRYMTDLLPVLGWFIAYGLDAIVAQWQRLKPWVAIATLSGIGLLMGISLYTQVVGAFAPNVNWDGIPSSRYERIWQWPDNQILRHTRGLYNRIHDPIGDDDEYLAGLDVAFIALQDQSGKAFPKRIQARPNQSLPLTAVLQNTGQNPWFGYQTGIRNGLAALNVRLYDNQDNQISLPQGYLYVSGTVQPGAIAYAVGEIVTPSQPGNYRLEMSFTILGMGDPPSQENDDVMVRRLIVRNQQK